MPSRFERVAPQRGGQVQRLFHAGLLRREPMLELISQTELLASGSGVLEQVLEHCHMQGLAKLTPYRGSGPPADMRREQLDSRDLDA